MPKALSVSLVISSLPGESPGSMQAVAREIFHKKITTFLKEQEQTNKIKIKSKTKKESKNKIRRNRREKQERTEQ